MVALPPLGLLLATINKRELQDLCQNEASNNRPQITECKVIGSYNWLNRKCPTILIPGSPPAWTPVPTPQTLPEDNDSYFRDQNAARFATHVFQPAIEAILHGNPKLDLNKLDIVACVSTLRNLLRFVTEPDQGFRMIVEAIGSTVFLVRRGVSPTETISGPFGYGHTFPEANTTWDKAVKGLWDSDISHEEDTPGSADELLRSMQNCSVSPLAAEDNGALTIEAAGTAIPQAAMFDLKTRSSRELKDVMNGELARLWLAQVPNFVVGFHNRGVFNDVRVENIRKEVEDWEKTQKSQLRKLAALLRTLTAFARGQPGGRFEVVFEGGGGELKLREIGGAVNCCISDALKQRWSRAGLKETQLDEGETLREGQTSGRDELAEEERRSCGWSDDSESEKDFTACSASSCGYCGHCGY
ncbi:hypothetical protein BJY01DRAFT_244900 [Aspergillus pseudoustus]|uniref:Uncharacterized protein n=1 Tax=Aspergillus pseudoustus TaxID=1810923 RepID=A0ABR4KHP6_9EURO